MGKRILSTKMTSSNLKHNVDFDARKRKIKGRPRNCNKKKIKQMYYEEKIRKNSDTVVPNTNQDNAQHTEKHIVGVVKINLFRTVCGSSENTQGIGQGIKTTYTSKRRRAVNTVQQGEYTQ